MCAVISALELHGLGTVVQQCKQYPPELLSLNPLALWPLHLCDVEP